MSWPTHGDPAAFRRRATLLMAGCCALVALALAATWYAAPAALVPALPLGCSATLLLGLWVHGSARGAARRCEVARSFEGLRVLHRGESFVVDSGAPVLGEYASRRHAARAAMDRGSWALVVHAWDRYYLLACRPAPRRREDEPAAPVAFRSRAVADVVPAILDDVAV